MSAPTAATAPSPPQLPPKTDGSHASPVASAANSIVVGNGHSSAPDLPSRPGTFGEMMGGEEQGYGQSLPMQNPALSSFSNRYAGHGGYGGYNSYGGYGGGGGMGMNSYGGGYGSGGMSSYNRFGGGMYGGAGGMDPYNNPTFSSQIQSQTMPAFAVLESLVTAFSSLAQLFESTYAATHSSFFAMVGVADQLGGLKTYLGQVLGLFSLVRLGKKILSWIRGDSSPGLVGSTGWAEEWRIGQALDRNGGRGGGPRPVPGDKKPSRKPLILFLLSAVGLPYLMTKLVRLLTELQKRRMENQPQHQGIQPSPYPPNANGSPSAVPAPTAPGTTQPLTFARTIWPFEATTSHELTLKRDEIVAVLQRLDAKSDGTAGASGWWRGRTRDGRVGWFPGNYVELLRRKEESQLDTPPQDTKSGNSFTA